MVDSKWQPPMGACWVISRKPPLILGGYVLHFRNICISKAWSLILALSGQRIFPKMLNTCSTGAEEAASAKYLLAGLESAFNCASAVF